MLLPTSCDLCPRVCGVNRAAGERGACGADGSLRIARAALHFWEEPPISGEAGSGTVFFSNCPLHCVYCQNADIAAGRAGAEIRVERLADICLELQEQGALNINMVTPTHYAPQISEAVGKARRGGLQLPIVWNTSGYERVEALQDLEGIVDIYLVDLKYANAKVAQAYSHAADYPEVALAAIDEMLRQVGAPQYDEFCGQERMTRGVVIRHLLLPGHLDDSMEAIRLIHERYGRAVRVSIMNQYTPVIDPQGAVAKRFPELLGTVSSEDYETLLDYADELGIQDYFWQDGPANTESFIPAFDLTGV